MTTPMLGWRVSDGEILYFVRAATRGKAKVLAGRHYYDGDEPWCLPCWREPSLDGNGPEGVTDDEEEIARLTGYAVCPHCEQYTKTPDQCEGCKWGADFFGTDEEWTAYLTDCREDAA